ncbi:class II fructose-1,6-bisphosphate aldolase [Athalassotoga saccharophila]|uniref:class II fructose-1,6-bisphosphate aldolase n=1 Tax=Athalassotoga saccharophila TaxID=1441386 RepID=UPI00137AF482|nr:class II fructose-1,6-bisphosphate aldolase [Athalassotoga saccharophila]BBJ27944.1 fructose-bisphosphate aldolase class II [Athalassotoga saccharophila]
MYVKSTKEILDKANAGYYGVGAFNINDIEFLAGIISAAVEKRSPVIIQASEGAMAYAGNGDFRKGAYVLADIVRRYADDIPVPVALHLDHGHDMDHVMAAIKAGFTSVMIDASAKPFEENLAITSEVVKIAHAAGISVEAELGKLVGVEDNVSVAERDATLVDPEEAKIFVEKTGVDFLAPAIGTSHGAFKFKGEAKLDFERLQKVKALTKLPLVLHGASSVLDEDVQKANSYGAKIEGAKGVPFEVLKESIKYGINKINTDTDLRIAFIAELRKALHDKPSDIDPRDFFKPAMEAVKKVVAQRMDVLGSSGKA